MRSCHVHGSFKTKEVSKLSVLEHIQPPEEQKKAVQELARLAVRSPEPAGLLLGYGAIATARIEEGLSRLRDCFEEHTGLATAGATPGAGSLTSPPS